ncbi:hypothetical protein [Rheinheimera sp. F8]|uniref:hypothetical protein n=1 Tax=Rheinheimera sp. F8 TaxID=1763998 RepID=UPI00074496EE|nr:hypothetical protein [Rheinheimera sp. F8]ALZ75399.1 hypothetical protein ATY27_06285 [Rheinheimera sp. F8]ALZ75787.1 hypothetical protein ATY27_08420 [Rheinheimera sp. F8]
MARFIFISLTLLMISCSKQESPEEKIENFYTTPDYNLLSSADKSSMTSEEWEKLDYNRLKPRLSGASRYFELERFLYSNSSSIVHPHTVDGDKKLIKVTFKHPALLHELGFFNEFALEYSKDKIEQAQVNFEKGLLTVQTLEYTTTEETFTLNNDGVFLDLAGVKERKEKYRKIQLLTESLREIDQLILKNHTHFHFNSSEYTKAIEELRLRGEQQVASDFQTYNNTIKKLAELDPDYIVSIDLGRAADAYRRLIVIQADNYFKNALTISKAKVADSTSREKALFFEWELKSPPESKLYGTSASFSAVFYDEVGRQIGYQELIYNDGPNGNGIVAGTIGSKIESQAIARKTSRVEVKYLQPVSVPMIKCSLNVQIQCDEL